MKFSFDLEKTADGFLRVALDIDGEVAWPHPDQDEGSSDFDPEDVVSYLTDAWPSLLLAQSWPIDFEEKQQPHSMTGLLRAAENRWAQPGAVSLTEIRSEEILLDAFLYNHDLSQMKHGASLKSCFVLRQHTNVQLETNGRMYEDIPFVTFASEINKLYSLAVELLQERTDSAAIRVIKRGENREQIDPITAAALLSGLPRHDIEGSDSLQKNLVSAVANRTLSDIANDNNSPIYAAARSAGILGPASLAEILWCIRSMTSGNTVELNKLRRLVRGHLRGTTLAPRDQGIRAANYVRDWLRLSDDDPVDSKALSDKLLIHVVRQALSDERLDGIATCGPAHGPSIVLNSNTRRRGAGGEDLERSLRFTWLHEVGHLILDRDEWPALIDAAKQRVPRSVETRANAFAAHLLLPMRTAYRLWDEIGAPLDWEKLEPFLNRLASNFGLPRIAASRQVMRGAPQERQGFLRQTFKQYYPEV